MRMKGRQYELIEALASKDMDKMCNHEFDGKTEPNSYLIGSPMMIVKYILKIDLKRYKIVKR